MATQAQITANRRNAQKSTGPNTDIGKATSAFNARKHGLNARLDATSVTAWFRIILDDDAAYPNPSESSERLQAARWLAEAEARLEQVWREEEAFLLDPDPGGVDAANAADVDFEVRLCRDVASDYGWDKEGLRLFRGILKFKIREQFKATNRRTQKTRLPSRYRAEAEAQRNKALRYWINVGFGDQSA